MKIPKEDGVILLSGLFGGFLSKKGNDIYLSLVISMKPNNGNLSKLIDSIIAQGYTVKVPTPLPHMEAICKAKGFELTYEPDELTGTADVYKLNGGKC